MKPNRTRQAAEFTAAALGIALILAALAFARGATCTPETPGGAPTPLVQGN